MQPHSHEWLCYESSIEFATRFPIVSRWRKGRRTDSVTDKLLQIMPPEGLKILLTLFLCFLIGLEREEHRAAGQRYSFGGVRTFPLIGLTGYAMALLSGDATASVDVWIWRDRRVPVALLPAQTGNVQRSRSDHGNFRAGHLRDRRAGVARSIVDRHDHRRDQHAAARVEGISRKPDDENSGR